MKILMIGSGGREHALAWKLRHSPQVQHVWCAPGNGGIAEDAECVPADVKDVGGLAKLAGELKADLTVVGPELPLALGIGDEFRKRGLPIVGPSQQAAQLESSKIFAKEFLTRHNIPTAPLYGIHDSPGDAYSALCAVDWPMVIKADGLCAGKGVLVAQSPDEATAFIDRLMEKKELGDGGTRLLMEEALEGEELSYIVMTDGTTVVPMVPTRDHKRLLDGNRGPNTGGMGAYSTDTLLPAALEQKIRSAIVDPVMQALRTEGIAYSGFLYFGLMLTKAGPEVLEFNCRLGDPETQAIVMRMDFDLAEALRLLAAGKLAEATVAWNSGASACVVMASGGYPGEPATGKLISGLPTGGPAKVFHAGTKVEGGKYYTSGGRVLGISAAAPDLSAALKLCYDTSSNILFDGAQFRKDIGAALSASAVQG